MANASPLKRCQLCNRLVEEPRMMTHRRTVHQVAAGETTIADVPISEAGQKKALNRKDGEPRLVPVRA